MYEKHDIVEEGHGHDHNTWISQPGSGLDKQQCRGKTTSNRNRISGEGKGREGKRIRPDEKEAWHPDVHVFFQENAWVNTIVATDWVKTTLKPFVEAEEVGHYMLYADNLSAQESEPFIDAVVSSSGVATYGLAGAMDLWQPVDAGVAQIVKQSTVASHRDW